MRPTTNDPAASVCACLLTILTLAGCSSGTPATPPSDANPTSTETAHNELVLPQAPDGVVRGVGHGAFFDRDGRVFKPSLEQIELTQQYLFTALAHPSAHLDEAPANSGNIIENSVRLSHGLRASTLRNRATFIEVNAATLNYYLRHFAPAPIRDDVVSLKRLLERESRGGATT